MDQSSQSPCINCGYESPQNFCPVCGQKTRVNPITWRGLIVELSSRWLGADNRIVRTFTGLWVHPRRVVEEYLAGNRVKYIGPLSYLIVMTALFILSFQIFGVEVEDYIGRAASLTYNPDEVTPDQEAFMKEYMNLFYGNMRIFAGILIPFLALSMRIFYRKRNYLQNFLIASYLTAHLLWLSIISIAIYGLTGTYLTAVTSILGFVYYVWVIGLLNTQKYAAWTYIKSLIVWLLGYFLFMVTISIATLVYFISQIPRT